jgi:hypothetical protein
MPEQITPARVVIVDYTCDACGVGKMVRDGLESMSRPRDRFMHACTACGVRKAFEVSYPETRVERQS